MLGCSLLEVAPVAELSPPFADRIVTNAPYGTRLLPVLNGTGSRVQRTLRPTRRFGPLAAAAANCLGIAPIESRRQPIAGADYTDHLFSRQDRLDDLAVHVR